MKHFAYQDVLEATESFSPSRLIGKGSHGLVYKATLIVKNGEHKEVAIKKTSLQETKKLLDNEINILSSLRHNPHVIDLLGTCRSATTNLLVMELMPNGSLHDLLHSAASPPPWPRRVEITVQVARAIRSLHCGSPPVIHRDVKSANVLFDSDWNVKLADFGLAIMARVGYDRVVLGSVSRPAGTMGYLDPCYTASGKLSTKNDVFSFGVLLLEIFSSGKVIDVRRAPADIVEWAVPAIKRRRWKKVCDARVPVPGHMERTVMHMLRIAASCVSGDENRRPSIGQVVDQMEGCFVERLRFPVWASILIFVKRRRRLARKWRSGGGTKCDGKRDGDRKMLLREILADFSAKEKLGIPSRGDW